MNSTNIQAVKFLYMCILVEMGFTTGILSPGDMEITEEGTSIKIKPKQREKLKILTYTVLTTRHPYLTQELILQAEQEIINEYL